MKKIDLSMVDEKFLESYYRSIDIESITTELSDNKYENITTSLESLIKADLNTIENELINLCESYSNDERIKIKNAFDYAKHRQNKDFMKHFKKLNIKSCPFCNNNYIYFYKENGEKYNTIATLEHYYPKSKYPHLSLSFYNLIPSCYICNSKFKGNDSYIGEILHPYFEDFNEKAEFGVNVESLPIHSNIELNLELTSNDKRCDETINRFHLKEIYASHNDIAKEIWDKAQFYNESRIKELYKSFYKDLGYSKEDIKNMIFCNYLNKDDINKRNHSKLTQDILKQFNI